MRVVSLVPSATESLCFLGYSSSLVARSHECDFPPEVLRVPSLTSSSLISARLPSPSVIDASVRSALASSSSLYRLDADALVRLRPDLILTQDLCSVCSIDADSVRAAARRCDPTPHILSLNPHSFEDVLDDILRIHDALNPAAPPTAAHAPSANPSLNSIPPPPALAALRDRFFRAADHVNPYTPGFSVLFLEWTDPPFVAGHWTAQLIERAGSTPLLNPTSPLPGAGAGAGGQMAHRVAPPARQLTQDELASARPDVILISPCGVPLPDALTHADSLLRTSPLADSPAVSRARAGISPAVAVLDGCSTFSRPGPRLVDCYQWLVAYLNSIPSLLPRSMPHGAAWRAWHP